MMIQSVKEIQNLFKEIDEFLQGTPETEKLEIYMKKRKTPRYLAS